MLTMKRAILAETELTYGTDPAPTGALNAMEVFDVSFPAFEHTKKERMPARPFLGSDSTIIGATPYKIDFTVQLAGAGAAGTAPPYAPLLKACGLGETLTALTDADYEPVSASFGSITVYDNIDGILHKGTGCRGNLQLEFNHGDVPMAKFSFTGIHAAPADTALPALTLTAWQDPLIMNKTNTQVSLHGATPPTGKISIDLGNVVTWKDHVNADEEVRITDRVVTGSITIEADAISVKDWFDICRDGTLGALQIIHGTAAGNKVQIDAASVQLLDPKVEDVDGIVNLTMAMKFLPTAAGNDELTLKVL